VFGNGMIAAAQMALPGCNRNDEIPVVEIAAPV
jgi:hypothetical protein